MHRIWACAFFILSVKLGFAASARAQTEDLSVTTSNVAVIDKVGGGLLTLNGISDTEPRTMVAILGGSEGGYVTVDSPLVMGLLFAGHRVASVAYHGATGTPKHLSEVSIDAVASRIAALGEASGVPAGCIGIVGISKGGELTLLLASLSDVGDVHVAITPSDVVWQASNPSLLRRSSWTHSGQPLPFVKYPRFSRATFKALRDVGQSGDLHALAMRKTKNLDAMRIPIERADTPILLQVGTHDKLWPTEVMSQRLMSRLKADKPDHNVKLGTYELDHYLSNDAKVRADALGFLNKHFTQTCHNTGQEK